MTDRLIETFTAPTAHRVDILFKKTSPLLGERGLTVFAACAATMRMESAIAECGVANGETAAALAQLAAGRRLYLFDTFGTCELSARNSLAAQAVGTHARSVDDVAATMGVHQQQAIFVPGLFRDTLPPFTMPLSFLHADGDLYESTCNIIAMADRCVVQGGVVVFDDYGTEWTGVTRAVDENLQTHWRTYAVAGVGQLVAVRQ